MITLNEVSSTLCEYAITGTKNIAKWGAYTVSTILSESLKHIVLMSSLIGSYATSYEFYSEIKKPLEERTWTYIDFAQATILLSFSGLSVVLAIRNMINKHHIIQKYANSHYDLPDDRKNIALIIKTPDDSSHAVWAGATHQREMFEEIEKVYPVILKDNIKSAGELQSAVSDSISDWNSVKLLVIDTHGNATNLVLGDDIVESNQNTQYARDQSRDKREQIEENLKKAFNLLDFDAKIVLLSCSAGGYVGRNTYNIASYISQLASGREVITPKTSITAYSSRFKAINLKQSPSLDIKIRERHYLIEIVLNFSAFITNFAFLHYPKLNAYVALSHTLSLGHLIRESQIFTRDVTSSTSRSSSIA